MTDSQKRNFLFFTLCDLFLVYHVTPEPAGSLNPKVNFNFFSPGGKYGV